MNWLDIVILLALAVPTFIGLKQGIIKAAMSLAGVIVGAILASNFSEELGGVLGFIDNPDIANIVAYIIILVAVMVVASVLAKILKFTVKAVSAVQVCEVSEEDARLSGTLPDCLHSKLCSYSIYTSAFRDKWENRYGKRYPWDTAWAWRLDVETCSGE